MRKPTSVMARGSLVVACGLLALTGCASGGAGSTTGGSTVDTSSAPNKVMDQAEWSKVVDAANKEGEVVIYGSMGAKSVEVIPVAFQKDYPNIKLTYVRLSPADITARVDAEIAAGNAGADVIDNLDHPTMDAYAKKGALAELNIPAVGDKDYDRAKYQRTPYVARFGDTVYSWAWNTNLLPKGITSWQDYLALPPSQVGVLEPSLGTALVAQLESVEAPNTGGAGFLDKLLAKGKPRVYAGSNPAIAAMAAGEVSAAFIMPAGNVATIKATGAPIDYRIYPNAMNIPGEVAVIKTSKHPNAGLVYANWLLSKAGQDTGVAQGGNVPVLKGATSLVQVPPGVQTVEMPLVTTEQFKAFQVRWNQLLNK